MDVLISGASIAGPALAYWLRNHGFAVTIVERAPGLRPGGHAVDIRGTAREVVERMGLMGSVREHCVDERGFALVDDAGTWLATMPRDLFGGEGIVAEIEIMRGDLSRVLYDATRDGVEYVFDDRITGLTETATGVDVVFASGAKRRFDLVIGADGVHSAVRGLAFGPETEFVRFLGAYTAYFTVPDPGDLRDWFLMYNAPGGLVAGIRPERGGTAKAMLSFTSPRLDVDRRDPAAQQRVIAERMAGAGWLVPSLLRAMPEAPDFFFDEISQVRVERWWRGRTALIGDAGYCGSPLAGLGTSMSLVGAYILAGELARTPGDHEAAFARYQDAMRDYTERCMQLPPGGVNGFAPRTQFAISMRARSMRMMHRWPMRSLLARQFAKSDGITLPVYPVSHQV